MNAFSAKEIALQGDRFYAVAEQLYNEGISNDTLDSMLVSMMAFTELMSPIVVNGCIACELYFKALLYHFGVDEEELKNLSHNLFNLYEKLIAFYQTPIPANLNLSEETFKHELELVKTTFVSWRYYYELPKTSPKISITFIINLGKALQQICRDILGDYSLK